MPSINTEWGEIELVQDEKGNWVIDKKEAVMGTGPATTPIAEAGKKTRAEQKYQANIQKVSDQLFLEGEAGNNPALGDPMKRYEEAKTGSFIGNLHGHAKAESTDMALGITDMINGLRWSFSDDPEEKARLIEDHHELQQIRDNMNEFYKPQDLATFGSKLGKMFPYLVTGSIEGMLGRSILAPLRTIESAVNKISPHLIKGVGKIENELLKSDLETVGKMASTGYEKLNDMPIVKSMRQEGNWTHDPFYKDYKPTLVGTGVTGAIEGAIQEDSSGLEGSITNVMANMLGKKLFSGIRATPNENTELVNNLVNEAVGKGYELTPGIKLGNRTLQQDESKKAGAGPQAQVMYRHKLNNLEITNETVWDWLGLPKQERGTHRFTPEVLQEHGSFLGSQYDEITKASTGRFPPEAAQQWRGLLEYHLKSPSIHSQEIYASIKPYIDQFDKTRTPTKGPDGKFQKGNFEGWRFQEWNEQLKSDIGAAYAGGKPQVAKALEDIQHLLKESLQDGIEEYGSKADAADWADLDRQYFMFNTLQEEGLDELGNVNLDKLSGFFNSPGQIKDYLKSKSIAFNPLHGLTKIREIQKVSENAGLGGTATEGNPVRDEIPQMSRANDTVMPIIPLLKHQASMGKYGPGFGTSGSGLGDPGVTMMAFDQAVNLHEGGMDVIGNTVNSAYGGMMDFAEGYENYSQNVDDRLSKDLEAFHESVTTGLMEWLLGEDEKPTQDPSGANL